MGDDIPHVPNKRGGGLCLGGKIAPIFFNTMEDAGALPIEVDVSNLNMGDVIDVYPYKGEVRNHETGELLATFELKTDVLIDEVRAGLLVSPNCQERQFAASLPGPAAAPYSKEWPRIATRTAKG